MARFIPVFIKNYFFNAISSRGFISPRDLPPVELRGWSVSPVEAMQRAKHSPILLDIPLSRCRALGLMAYPCDSESHHPFIRTLKEYSKFDLHDYQWSELKKYYECIQPSNGAEYLGLKNPQASPLFFQSPLCMVEPWLGSASEKYKARKIQTALEEAEANGLAQKKATDWNFIGPLNDARGAVEHRRLIRLYKSVQANGYVRNDDIDGDITGFLLVRGEEFRVIINRGQHRICALAALGHDIAPIRFLGKRHSLVMRNEVNQWPGVISGSLSIAQALEVFDRMFEGRQPEAYRDGYLGRDNNDNETSTKPVSTVSAPEIPRGAGPDNLLWSTQHPVDQENP